MPNGGRSRMRVALALSVALVLPLAACSAGAEPAVTPPPQVDAALPGDTEAQLQAAVEHAVAASGASGAVVGVWAPWSGKWLAGVGTLKPGGSKVSDTTSFAAATVTRAMTCDVLYGAAKDGIVDLDDSVGSHVSGVPALADVTLRDLCDSTGGVKSYLPPLMSRVLATPERVWSDTELVSPVASSRDASAPGTVFSDSDSSYVLLGMALEDATRKSSEELFEQYVFGPIGMTNSSLPSKPTATLEGLWSPSAEDGSAVCAEPLNLGSLSPTLTSTSGGVVTDLEDLGLYTRALATGSRPYDTKKRFDDPLPAAPDAPSWFTATGGTYQAGSLVGQYGSIPGYLTAAFADRNTGMTVVVALNNSRASDVLVRSLAWQLAAIASKVPAAAGQTAPEAGLPWTAEDMAAQVTAAAVCPIP